MANKYRVARATIMDKPESKTKAYMDVVINDCFEVKGVRVIEAINRKTNKPFTMVSMPGYVDREGKFHEQLFPITAEDRTALHEAVLTAYQERKLDIAQKSDIDTDITTKIYINTRDDINRLATANITIAGGFAINGISIVENSQTKEPFLSFPGYKVAEGNYKDMCSPVTKAMYNKIKDTVLSEYKKEVDLISDRAKQISQKEASDLGKSREEAMKSTEDALTR